MDEPTRAEEGEGPISAPGREDQVESGIPEDSTERSYRRRQYIVDKNIQYYYLTAWISAVVLFVLIGFAIFVMLKVRSQESLDVKVLDTVYRMLLLNSVFLVLFAILMGLHSILHTHRIAGAAYHIRENLRKINRRVYVPLVLRKKDYLKDVADEVNHLRQRLEIADRTKHELIESLEQVEAEVIAPGREGQVSDDVRRAIGDMREKVTAL